MEALVHGVTILTADEMLEIGLKIVQFTALQVQRVKHAKNVSRFVTFYGSSPYICATIWESLQTTTLEDARIPPEMLSVKYFLMAMNHLKQYPTEQDRAARFHVSEKWGRMKCWYYIEKIAALKAEKIYWPDDLMHDSEIWCMSVDGTHFWIQEPAHSEFSMDTKYFSHKCAKAALNYELGIALSSNRLIWMNGPYPAGENDGSVFKNHGLKDKLRSINKKAIGDLGYAGHYNEISIPNASDYSFVKLFKSRALKRHETFNGMIKRFHSMDGRFRHSIDRFKSCFEAIAVICQYKIESDQPLFDILVDNVLDTYLNNIAQD